MLNNDYDYSMRITQIPWPHIKAVIFDVDGTLYDPRHLWVNILKNKLNSVSFKHFYVFHHYLRVLEMHAGKSISHPRVIYETTARYLHRPPLEIENIVHESRLFFFKHMSNSFYPGLISFYNLLSAKGIKRVFYSDEPIHEKFNGLNLSYDLSVTATDVSVLHFKPTAKGLKFIADTFCLHSVECLLIGDRLDRDGHSAILANMPFIILPKRRFFKKPTSLYWQLIHGMQKNIGIWA